MLGPPHRKGRWFLPRRYINALQRGDGRDRKTPLRWKLLIIASLAAVVAGAGGGALLLYLLTGRAAVAPAGDAGWPALAALVLPLAAITYACVFVYRRTARRRRLQAALTALVSLSLTLAVYFAIAIYTTCCAPPLERTPPAPAPRNVG